MDDAQSVVVLLEDDDGRLEVLDPGEDVVETPAVQGARLVDLVVDEDLPTLRAAAQHAHGRQQQSACEVRLVTVGESSQWFEVRYLPMVPADGHLVLLRDVTRARRLAAEAAVLRRITELANSATDAESAVGRAVDDLCDTLGWRAGRVLRLVDGTLEAVGGGAVVDAGDPVLDLVARIAPAGTRAAERAAAQGVPVATDEGALPESLRELGVTTVVAVPVVAGDEVVRVLEFHADDDAAIDEEQRSLLAEVGRQLGWVVLRELSVEELEASHAELTRSNAELERFAYVASHDLQEPLRKIVGFTELLQQHHEPLDDDEAEYRRYVVESAHRLQRLIKDLLAYSRAGRRQLAREPVDLRVVVGQVLEDLALAIEEQAATVEVGELPVVVGDDGQLREVFQNLVSNALKYRAEDREPVISIRQEEAGRDQDEDASDHLVDVVVADNGIGIEAGHREVVFEVFRRLHPAHLYGGTGLGLAMVQRIVARHGGTVSITDSPVGEGIAVHLALPRHQEQP